MGKAKAGAQAVTGYYLKHGSRPKLGHSCSFSQVSIGVMEQGQSWGTCTVSVRLASGIWPELARVKHNSSQILHHTCEAQLQILYALVGYVYMSEACFDGQPCNSVDLSGLGSCYN